MIKRLLLILIVSGLFQSLYSQNYNINSGGTITTCSGNFYDSGGAGADYSGNEDYTITFCPSDVTKCLKITFDNFQTEKNKDSLVIYNGPTTASPSLGTYSGNVSPGIVISSPGGCLTFRFKSTNAANKPGWQATIICDCTRPNTDCVNKKPICNDITLNDNNNGKGSVNDLNGANQDCLASGENQSSWYYVKFTSAGTFNFKISPSNGADDYDFAIYGPNPDCPPTTPPARCSYCPPPYGFPLDYTTGIKAAGGGTSEGATVCDGWLNELNVNTGEIYILVIDNFSGTNSGFTLDLGGTAGRDCAITVPLELFTFNVKESAGKALLEWQTASEVNSEYFIIEKSPDGSVFDPVGKVPASVESSDIRKYSYKDEKPFEGVTYYRLRQMDTDGSSSYSQVLVHSKKLILKAHVLNDGNSLLIRSADLAHSSQVQVLFYNVLGANVYESTGETGPDGYKVDISSLNKGVYFIRVNFPGFESGSLKIVK